MKKLNKFFAVLVALAMMATMAVTMAFAGDEMPTAKTTTAPLKKSLTVPQGTAIPEGAKATFTFTDEKVNGEAAKETDKTIDTKTIEFKGVAAVADNEKNVDVYNYSIEDVLEGVKFTRPGVYTWNVKEATFDIDDKDDATTDVKKADNATYTLSVSVVYDEDGNLVVDDVAVKKGSDVTEDKDDADISEDGLSFANSYYTTTGNPGEKQNPENPGDPDDKIPDEDKPGDESKDDAGLSVEKVVEGTYGDKNTQFEITVNVALPQIAGADEAKAVIRRADGTVEAQAIVNGKNPVKLASGDKLVFTKIAEGTKYTVEENDSRKGTAANQYTATGEIEEAVAVVKAGNSVTITNKSNQDDVTPTGILINNLPYIALALVAVGGLVAYVVVRRRDNENA